MRCRNLLLQFLFIILFASTKCARILAVFPTPSISHQVVFRPLTQELVKRGHEVIVVTTDPMFPDSVLSNLTEIDLHDISYKAKEKIIQESIPNQRSPLAQIFKITDLFSDLIEAQLKSVNFKKLLSNNRTRYDLLILEAWVRPILALSHIFKAPVIQISSFGSLLYNNEALGVPIHPIRFPTFIHRKTQNLSLWDKITEIHSFLWFKFIIERSERAENAMLRRVFGPDIPSVAELSNNIDLMLLNNHPMWGGNVPTPPNVIFVGGIYKGTEKPLPEDLNMFLNSSKNGVIYFSLGNNVESCHISLATVKIFFDLFAKLPYDVLWKWDGDLLPGKSDNIKTSKWFPQSDLLRHPKIKLFITQGGLQSTEEAIAAGVPLIGIPFFGDQYYNSEKYVQFKIGKKLYINSITENSLREAITTIVEDDSFRHNILMLRSLMNDQPQRPLERAVWWTEHVLRHGGARHLRSSTANITWAEYLEIEVLAIISAFTLVTCCLIVWILKYLFASATGIIFDTELNAK